jgi:tetratricopeptide (TPR) repeat protein
MVESQGIEVNIAYNERSLKTMTRAIKLSQGNFSLILARCNHANLREQIRQTLHQQCDVEIQELYLTSNAKNLYTTILNQFGDKPTDALMVFGLESVESLDNLLAATNKLRDKFLGFAFPVVLWVTDAVLKKLVRVAPDLKSWASPPIQFVLPNEQLSDFLRQKAEQAFAENPSFVLERTEIEAVEKDLQSGGQSLDPELKASLEFLLGLVDYESNQIDSALEHYQQSLAFWQQERNLHRQALLYLHLGLAYERKGQESWEESRDYIQQGLDLFEQVQRLDLVAKHIDKLSKILQRLKAWEPLHDLAEKALRLHEHYGQLNQVAQDYGFLAEAALKTDRFSEANRWAQQALNILENIPDTASPNLGLYYWILAKSQQQLGEIQNAISSLEKARDKSHSQDNPIIYLQILQDLRSLNFGQGEYLAAFNFKLEEREIKSKYGLQAFIGAGRLQPPRQVSNLSQETAEQQAEMAEMIVKASGRQKTVNDLLERIKNPKYKLTVIYGPSGVGKSSILQAGLVPALQLTSFTGQEYLPILVQGYTNWVGTLGNSLAKVLDDQPIGQKYDTQTILELLRSMENHLFPVLIFDQFEEFFFDNKKTASRQDFYDFLRYCLEEIPFLKVILSLREDYLYYLLEFNRTTTVTKLDLNHQDILYYLGNLKKEDTKSVIQSLTERSDFHLDDDLVDELVEDLSGELGEKIRPIELQVVGAELEAERITQLSEYKEKGPKDNLVERYIGRVVENCGTEGSENIKNAWRTLFFFIDEKEDTRPIRTENELTTLLNLAPQQLQLILEIFKGAGLIFFVREDPANCYQLVHDYLVKPIRQIKTEQEVEQGRDFTEQIILVQEQLKRVILRVILVGVIMVVGILIGVKFGVLKQKECNSSDKQSTLTIGSLSHG